MDVTLKPPIWLKTKYIWLLDVLMKKNGYITVFIRTSSNLKQMAITAVISVLIELIN